LERDERLFIEGTVSRARQLVRQQIWSGVDEARLDGWFGQFETRQCSLLGACLLDGFIFRSRAQVEAMLHGVLCRPELVGPAGDSDQAVINALKGRADPGIRLAPVIHLEDPPIKSGTYVLRRLFKLLRLNQDWATWPQNLARIEGLRMIVFVDDFCGSGKQFSEFIAFAGLDQVIASNPQCRFVYLTVAAHEDGIAFVRKAYPQIEFIVGEVLSADHHFFEGGNLRNFNVDGLVQRLRADYDRIAQEVGFGRGKVPALGFEEQALCYAFDHGTPNNTLPIFWNQKDQWSSLVDR
jgi:hypothetical protein